jgi:hypothetical protein
MVIFNFIRYPKLRTQGGDIFGHIPVFLKKALLIAKRKLVKKNWGPRIARYSLGPAEYLCNNLILIMIYSQRFRRR